MPTTKYLVSNRAALTAKYLEQEALVESAFAPVVAADRAAGITTTVLFLDDVAAMRALGAPPVTAPGDERQVKAAIDGVFASAAPTSMTIFGAPDVVPHQTLENPKTDPDPDLPSDLPYACTAAYSTKVADFLGPTRDVTRLPDVTGHPADGPASTAYALRVLADAADRRQGTPAQYTDYFGLSCAEWEISTRASLTAVFGDAAALHLSPPDGPSWRPAQMAHLSFFVNAHGSSDSPKLSGQLLRDFPVCLTSAGISGRLTARMVASVEACYGAQLYDPAAAGTDMAIVNEALRSGCCGYLGSSNIAYGPPRGQGQADIICQRFLVHVLQGSTVGQAALAARQDFVRTERMREPSNLKTLGQFMIMGDSGFAPVLAPHPPTAVTSGEPAMPIEFSEPAPADPVPDVVAAAIAQAADRLDLVDYSVTPHRVVTATAQGRRDTGTRVYEVVQTTPRPGTDDVDVVSVEIVATDTEVLSVTETHSK